MFNSCLEKQNYIKSIFSSCAAEEDKYKKIIQFGKNLPKLDPEFKTADRIVKGCQSVMYLDSSLKDGQVFFLAESDALISAGLAALLIYVYNGESPEVVLKCPPDYLADLGISASLTPSRANGLYSVHLRMKQDAIRLLTSSL